MVPSFYYLFSNATSANPSISSLTFQQIRSLGILRVKNTNYNVALDYQVGVYFFDANWNYLLLLSFTALNLYPALYMIVVNGEFYFSLQNTYGLTHTTSQLKLLNTFNNDAGKYRSLCYDQVNKTVIAANFVSNRIDIFSQNLTLLSSISFASPVGLCVHGSRIYASHWLNSNYISVIQNGNVINNFTTLCSQMLSSITVDSYGYLALSCRSNNILYLYHVNGSYMNKYFSLANLFYANYDTQNRLAIDGINKIFVYY